MLIDEAQLRRALARSPAPRVDPGRLAAEVERRIAARRQRRAIGSMAGALAVVVAMVGATLVVVGRDDERSARVVAQGSRTASTSRSTPTSALPASPTTIGPTTTLPPESEWNGWAPLPVPSLGGRSGATLVHSEPGLFLWGGGLADSDEVYADGAWFDRSKGAWSPLPPSPLSARRDASGIWTGREIIVWGGVETYQPGRGLLATSREGASYRPETRRWQPIARLPEALDPPAGLVRSDEVLSDAVWTGTDMVVVALDQNSSVAADYDPENDEWESLPSPGPIGSIVGLFWTGDAVLLVAHEGRDYQTAITVLRWAAGSDRWERAQDDRLAIQDPDSWRPAWEGSTELVLVTNQGAPSLALDPDTLSVRTLPEYPRRCDGPATVIAVAGRTLGESCGELWALRSGDTAWRRIELPTGVEIRLSEGVVEGDAALWAIDPGAPARAPTGGWPAQAWVLPFHD